MFFFIVLARVYILGLKTSVFCRFWISSLCNLSVKSYYSFSLLVFCIFNSSVLQLNLDFLKVPFVGNFSSNMMCFIISMEF